MSAKKNLNPALFLFKLLSGFILFLACTTYSYGATPAGYSEYYIPGDEDLMSIIWGNIGATGGVPTTMPNAARHTIISVAAWSDNTTIYYDHWENGYNFDPNNPSTADETYTLNKGQSHIFESSNIPVNPRGTTQYYDGGDRIYVAGGAVSVSRMSWIDYVGNVFTVAMEVYPVKPQMTTYILPFGEDLAAAYRSFDRVFALVQATQDNTTVQFDFNGDGTYDTFCTDKTRATCTPGTQITLNRGQSFLIDDFILSPQSSPYNAVHTGTVIKASSTVQVNYIIGNHNDTYQARGFAAFPRGFWDTEYYSPVDSTNGTATYPTNLYLYNPNSSAITINYQTTAGSGSFSIASHTTQSFQTLTGNYVPQGSGVYLKGSDVFWGVAEIDDGGPTHEWGYSLVPRFLLSNEQFIGWAPSGTTPSAANSDDAGIYISPAQDNTMVFVDTNNDGVADQTFNLNRLQSRYVYNATTGDMSNSHFWASGPITLAYGQNPATAPTGAPAIDVGYGIFPGGDWIDNVLTVSKTANPVVVPTASGSLSQYTLSVNSYYFSVNSINVADTLPAGWSFFTDATHLTQITLANLTALSGSGANPAVAGQVLTWPNSILGSMAPNQNISITFWAQTTQAFNVGDLTMNQVKAAGTRTVGGLTQTFTATDFTFNTFGNFTATKTSSATSPVNPGNQFTYTVTVTNPPGATSNQTGISINDPLPDGEGYVPGSGSVTCELPKNVRDEFATAAYTNNGPNNTNNWAGNWTETDSYGGGATGATGGFVWITGGQLQFRYLDSTAQDNFDGNNFTGNNGSANWSAGWTENDTGGNGVGAGYILVNTTRLNFNSINAGNPVATGSYLSRAANLSGATSATLSVVFSKSAALVAGDTVVLEISPDGAAWTTLQTFSGSTGAATYTYNVAAYISATTTIRFRITGGFVTLNTHRASFDNIGITYNAPVIGTQVQRTADLTGALSPQLSFSYSSAGLAAGDTLVVEAGSGTAGPFTILGTFTGGTPSVAPPYDLTPYISANTTIRYRVTGGFNAAGKTFVIDNVDITYGVSSTFAAGSPPEFLSGGTGCRIRPGNSLTLTFNVAVDNPLATGIDRITNIAAINSNEMILPISASVTNIVVDPSSNSAEVGNKVWFDADGDGVPDVGEPGLANIEVTLKDQFGTPTMTTTTDATGHYLFTGVEPGSGYYVEATSRTLPAGLQQSSPAGRSDNRTASFTLSSGQSYTAADLGYKPAPGTATFGDMVWSDFNSNGIRDAGEPGLAGVTVQLWRDTNSNGALEPGTDTLVGTTTTAADGSYLFTGVTASGTEDYLVYIDETQVKLSGYTRTIPSYNAYYASNMNAGSSILSLDFGYRGTTYTIKDRVWFDASNYGILDAGETGIALVTVDLLDASLNAIATVTTDNNGYFTFSGVAGVGADYTLRITDINGKLADYFATTASANTGTKRINNLTANIDNSSAPSFGYSLKKTIGSVVYNDINGNNTQDSGELGISGVTVKLYADANGNGRVDGADAVISTITTDSNGLYLFSGLSDGNYVVSIESPPGGYNYSGTDSDPVTTGQQKAANIAGGINSLANNFGYQAATPRSVSGTIWTDKNFNGIIDASEGGIAGVTMELQQGSTVIASASTAADGSYSFNSVANGTYTVRITDINSVLSGDVPTYEKTEGTTPPFNGQENVDLSGGNQININFGFQQPRPTLAVLSLFDAYEIDGQVVVAWETSSEVNTVGFYLSRLDKSGNRYIQLNSILLPSVLASPQGGSYSLRDKGAVPGKSYTYLLTEVETSGKKNNYGPFTVFTAKGRKGANIRSVAVRTSADSVISEGISGKPGRDLFDGYIRKTREMSDERKGRLLAAQMFRESASALGTSRPGSMIKMPVTKDGLYYIEASRIADLLGIRYDTATTFIRTSRLAMSNQGSAVAYLPAEDYSGIYFYGQGTKSIYTDENIYWLYYGTGRQMRHTTDDEGPALVELAAFPDTKHAEEDRLISSYPFMDPESDIWFWDQIFSGYPPYDKKTFSIDAQGAANVPATASLTVNLQGITDTQVNPDHHVVVSVNGTIIGEDWWNGTEKRSPRFEFSQQLLNNGPNMVEVEGLLDTSAPWSLFYIDSFDLSYSRLYEAADNALLLKSGNTQDISVYGFSDPDILVFDVTNPGEPVLTTASADQCENYYCASFVPAAPESVYLAVTRGAAVNIAGAKGVSPSHLMSRGNKADYILIAPDGLIEGAQALAHYRQQRGLTPMVVSVEDIMNEFNYGLSSPKAIQAFLTYAYKNWARPPKYVVLVGDASYDYRNNLHYGENLVPTMVVRTPDGLFTSDNILADVNSDHLPEMSIGRLPVLTPEELKTVIDKIIAYEKGGGNSILMLADNADEGGEFPVDSDDIAALIPSRYRTKKIYLNEYQIDVARQMLFSEINRGTNLINYMGHASSDSLSAANLLQTGDVASLVNSNRPFVLNAMTCMLGQFAFPGADSLSETLVLKKDGGAVAVWAPSGLAHNIDSKLIDEYFFRTNLTGTKTDAVLGSSILKSFRNFYNQGGPSYVLDIYNLQGDPALKLW